MTTIPSCTHTVTGRLPARAHLVCCGLGDPLSKNGVNRKSRVFLDFNLFSFSGEGVGLGWVRYFIFIFIFIGGLQLDGWLHERESDSGQVVEEWRSGRVGREGRGVGEGRGWPMK